MSRRRPLESRFAALRPSCRGGGQPARPRGQEDILIGLHRLAAARARRDACDTALGLGSPGLAGSGASLSPHSLSAAPPLRSGPGGVSSRAGPPAGHPASLPRPGSENLISPLGRVSGAGACFLTKPKERPLMGAASWASPVRRCRCLYLGSGSFGRPGGSQCTPIRSGRRAVTPFLVLHVLSLCHLIVCLFLMNCLFQDRLLCVIFSFVSCFSLPYLSIH